VRDSTAVIHHSSIVAGLGPRVQQSTAGRRLPLSTLTPVAGRRCLHWVRLPAANQSRLCHLTRPPWGWAGFKIY